MLVADLHQSADSLSDSFNNSSSPFSVVCSLDIIETVIFLINSSFLFAYKDLRTFSLSSDLRGAYSSTSYLLRSDRRSETCDSSCRELSALLSEERKEFFEIFGLVSILNLPSPWFCGLKGPRFLLISSSSESA